MKRDEVRIRKKFIRKRGGLQWFKVQNNLTQYQVESSLRLSRPQMP